MEAPSTIEAGGAEALYDSEADVDRIVAYLTSLNKSRPRSEVVRQHMLQEARSLVRALETPRETMIRHLWGQPTLIASIAIGADIGLFSEMQRRGGICKASDLAKQLAVDQAVLARIMKHIASMGHLVEVGPDEYRLTSFSRYLSSEDIGSGYSCLCAGNQIAIMRLPEYLHSTNYADPTANGPWKYAHQTNMSLFEWLAANPIRGMQFGQHMSAYAKGQLSWTDIYPVEERLLVGLDQAPQHALIVDVGGSHGHVLQEFIETVQPATGRVVLQDLPKVIDGISSNALDTRIEQMPHDFFEEQPVKGARAYYMRSVLHDWGTQSCLTIMRRIREAMLHAPVGYSKLLINEYVIPDTRANWEMTSLDMIMMAVLATKERTAQEWEALVAQAGLRVCNIWSSETTSQAVIECEVAEIKIRS